MHENKQTSPELKKTLLSWHRRFRLQKSIRWSVRGVAIGLIFGLVMLGVSRFFPWEYIPGFVLLLTISLGIAGAFWGATSSPSFAVVAHEIDGLLSLSERVGTAWEMQEKDSSVARLQRSDAIASINDYNSRDVVGLRPESFFIWAVVGALIGVVIIISVPNPQTTVIEERKFMQYQINTAVEQLSRPQSDEESLFDGHGDFNSNDVQMILSDAEQSIRNIDSKYEALEILSESIRKIEDIQREGEALDQIVAVLSDALIRNELSDEIPHNHEKLLDELREQIIGIDKQDSQRLLDNLYEASEINDSVELDALSLEVKKALESSDIDQVQDMELLLDDIETKQKRQPTEEQIIEAINKIKNAKAKITGVNRSIFTDGSVLGDGTSGNDFMLDRDDGFAVSSSLGDIPGNLPGDRSNVDRDITSPKGDHFIIPNRAHEVNLIPSNNLSATPMVGEIFSSKVDPVKFTPEEREYVERAQIPFYHQDLVRRYFYELANENTGG